MNQKRCTDQVKESGYIYIGLVSPGYFGDSSLPESGTTVSDKSQYESGPILRPRFEDAFKTQREVAMGFFI